MTAESMPTLVVGPALHLLHPPSATAAPGKALRRWLRRLGRRLRWKVLESAAGREAAPDLPRNAP